MISRNKIPTGFTSHKRILGKYISNGNETFKTRIQKWVEEASADREQFVEVHKQQDPRQSLESEQKFADDHRFNEILNPKMVLNLLVI